MFKKKHFLLLVVCLTFTLAAEFATPSKITATGLPSMFPDKQSRRPVTYRLTNGVTRTEWLTNAEENQLRKDIQRHEQDKAKAEEEEEKRRERQKEKNLEKKVRRLNRQERQKIKIGGKRIRYTKEMLRKKE
ncbi:MAG: hypothetical protein MJ106_02240 [Lentisphaeria bacterium]|nr:hypothetical protein [Lentisphaeria bacterium]